MTYASTAPDAITSLVMMLQAASSASWVVPGADALVGADVRDGPEVTDGEALRVVTVGYLDPNDDTSVDATKSGASDLAISSEEENYTIRCAAAVDVGEEAPAKSRAAVFALYAAVGAVIAADRRLRGTVMLTKLGNWSLRQDAANRGSVAKIRFDVDVRAFTKR